jgi:hypothetical protein
MINLKDVNFLHMTESKTIELRTSFKLATHGKNTSCNGHWNKEHISQPSLKTILRFFIILSISSLKPCKRKIKFYCKSLGVEFALPTLQMCLRVDYKHKPIISYILMKIYANEKRNKNWKVQAWLRYLHLKHKLKYSRLRCLHLMDVHKLLMHQNIKFIYFETF